MKEYSVGIVGYGWAAEAHIQAINQGTGGRVTKICSSRALDSEALSARHGFPVRTYRDYAAMLAEPDLDVVAITSYHRDHAAQAIAAARAGKHIIVEKPLALSMKDVRAVEQTVREAGVGFCICFELRFSAQFQAIASIVEQGLLGDIHYAEVDYYHGIGPWYREFLWCTTKEDCGSSLLEAGCHAMDALLLCVDTDVGEVFAAGSRSTHPTYAPYEYSPTTVTLLRFENGAVGKCASVIDCWQPYYFPTHLVGSEGSLLDDKFHSNRIEGLNRNRWNTLSYRPVDSGDVNDHPYQALFDRFFSALEAGHSMPRTGLAEAVRTHEVIFASMRSEELNRPVRIEEIRSP